MFHLWNSDYFLDDLLPTVIVAPAKILLGFEMPLVEARALTVVPKRAAMPDRVSPDLMV
jgi:hypothetical protein